MSRFPHVKRHRNLWRPTWEDVWCRVTLEDGTWGLGSTSHGRVTAAVIDDHLAPNLVGQDIFALEKIADMMFRMTKPYGSTGLAAHAVSAVDLALWDALGKLLEQPVYKLLGGPHKDRLFCYATGNDVDWYLELGFQAFKLACPYGPVDGLDGMDKNEEFVANARETIGPDRELMLDCWMAFDVDYTVRLAERLRPYRLKWMEECLIPEDLDGHVALRQRLPWQTLTTGEHWFTHVPFQWAANHAVVDAVQPDINWCGGLTTCRKIAAIADAAGIGVMLHGGARNPYGQHFSVGHAQRALAGVLCRLRPWRAAGGSRRGCPVSPWRWMAGLRRPMRPALGWRFPKAGWSRSLHKSLPRRSTVSLAVVTQGRNPLMSSDLPPVYTVTLNPGLDRTLTVPKLRENTVLRAVESRIDRGGKGFNVTRALHALGVTSVAMGFIGGFTGQMLTAGLTELGIDTDFIEIPGETRTNTVFMEADSGRYYKVNEAGPHVDAVALDVLRTRIEARVRRRTACGPSAAVCRPAHRVRSMPT